MDPIFVRSAHNYDMLEASKESALLCPEPTLTQQHFAEEVDINTIVRRFHLLGELPQNVRMPVYQDFTGVFDFHSAMNAITQAREAFDQMPAEIRKRFNNDPGAFVDFTDNKDNLAEARKLGLVPPEEMPPPEPEPMRVSIVSEPLRDPEGRFREQTRAEKRAEASAPPRE